MIHKTMLATALAASFSFLGLFGGPDKEYGDLSGALKRTMAQSQPPYHETANTAQGGRIRVSARQPPRPPRPIPPPPANRRRKPLATGLPSRAGRHYN